jgi:hypothetical protein
MEPFKYAHSTSFFFGNGDGSLIQWSIRLRKILKHYGLMMPAEIIALKTMADGKHLFLSDYLGH